VILFSRFYSSNQNNAILYLVYNCHSWRHAICFCTAKMNINIPTIALQKYWSPFMSNTRPWTLKTCISIEDVRRAVANNQLIGCNRQEHCGINVEELHIRRIAWFVVNGITLPISIFINPNRWIVTDGNHRYAAAIVRNDKYVRASLRGTVDYAERFFNIDMGVCGE
jgi:hypothetical protein